MAANKERVCPSGTPLGHMNGFRPTVYPFAFSSSLRGSPPFEVLTSAGYFRGFPTDLPKEMASLWSLIEVQSGEHTQGANRG
ncbi:hypothetical protein KIL84_020690 [Mauremys mutica]|uniref:Uncharacterized protein n=1 Tax=Mauremys mutica TaxID=74926 RepID=A0A9D3XA50_9SAUR|nr:hypothetical protein KIL84_020690 [Mauremys mutica]